MAFSWKEGHICTVVLLEVLSQLCHGQIAAACRKLILPFLEVFESAANRQFTPIVSTVEFTRLKRTLRRRDVLLLALPYCSKCA